MLPSIFRHASTPKKVSDAHHCTSQLITTPELSSNDRPRMLAECTGSSREGAAASTAIFMYSMFQPAQLADSAGQLHRDRSNEFVRCRHLQIAENTMDVQHLWDAPPRESRGVEMPPPQDPHGGGWGGRGGFSEQAGRLGGRGAHPRRERLARMSQLPGSRWLCQGPCTACNKLWCSGFRVGAVHEAWKTASTLYVADGCV